MIAEAADGLAGGMRIAVRSRYTNIHGGYEEAAKYGGHPALRRTVGGAWIFHAEGRSGSRWHFGPELPRAHESHVAAFFSSVDDGPSPDAVNWPEEILERVWQPDGDGGSRTGLNTTLWIDKDFPPNDASIGDIPELKGKLAPEWIPVRCLRSGEWRLFDGNVTPNDLLQGAIGNCWLVAAMASLAEFPESVEALFLEKDLSSNGKCGIRLFDARKGGHRDITIDEFIPCHKREWWDEEGSPVFARPNGNEAWVLLLEKAFAKMLGSYRELSGGNCCTAFRAFTGERDVFVWAQGDGESARMDGRWKKMKLVDGETHFEFNPAAAERRDDEGLWAELCGYAKRSFLVACSMRARHGQEHIRPDGLVEAHAYSLLHAAEVDGHRLLFLRNPWGNDKKWNGRWSDGDAAWAKNPSVRRRLRPRFQEDGTFWMAWADFEAIFDFVFVCPRAMRSREAAAEHERRVQEGRAPAVRGPAKDSRRRRLVEALPERLPILSPGTRVELLGLGLDLNGRVVEILGWDEAKGLYEVKDVPPRYWTCSACGEINRRARLSCNVCSGDREAPDLQRHRVRPECVVLPPGTQVELTGLSHFPELNGQQGRVVAFDRLAARYHVELPDGRVRAVRPPHVAALRRRPGTGQSPGRGAAEDDDVEFGRWAAPAATPSYVDEPEVPEEAPCKNDEDLRKVADNLDDDFTLKRDVELPGGVRLRRGQQLLREGKVAEFGLAELRRGGVVVVEFRLRFTRHSPDHMRFGPRAAHVQAARRVDAAIAKWLQDMLPRWRLGNGYHFLAMAQPGWACPAAPAAPAEAPAPAAQPSRPRNPKAWAGWVCPECGHINDSGTDYCVSCEPDG